MKKLKLDFDSLSVESFQTTPETRGASEGTVLGLSGPTSIQTCETCLATCEPTSFETCGLGCVTTPPIGTCGGGFTCEPTCTEPG